MTPEKLEEIRGRLNYVTSSAYGRAPPPVFGDVAALLAEVDRLRPLAQAGLVAHHGHHCDMAGGGYPDDPAECSDAVCRSWAFATK